jgi:hypothetical protein
MQGTLRQGATSGSVGFVDGDGKLISLQLYNSGVTNTNVTMKCAGNPHLVLNGSNALLSAEVRTVATGWTVACPSVEFTLSNGWDTNIDNLFIED